MSEIKCSHCKVLKDEQFFIGKKKQFVMCCLKCRETKKDIARRKLTPESLFYVSISDENLILIKDNLRKCNKCLRTLSLDEFCADRNRVGCRCKQCRSLTDSARYKKNQEKCKSRAKKWRENNPCKNKQNKRKRWRYRYDNDPNFKLIENMRNRVREAIKGNKKSTKTKNLLGAQIDQVRIHIESTWLEGMSWNNYGDWHIDHIIPCCTFDMSKEEDQLKCFHYSNLRALWKKDNLRRPRDGSDLNIDTSNL